MSLPSQFLGLALTLALLLVLSRWITSQVQIVGLRLTGNERFALTVYFLLMLPGIALHELSHAAMAKLLGLKVGKVTLGLRPRGKSVELGSVTVSSGGALRDSLVGLAPLLSGSVVLLVLGSQVFGVAALGDAWAHGGWSGVLQHADDLSSVPDFWLWAYVVFVVSNAMTPSPADRRPWLIAGLYLALALGLAYLLVGLPVLPDALSAKVSGALQLLTLSFLFTLIVDFLAAVVLLLLEVLIIQVQRT